MKVAIHTWGSEGDVRPSIILAERLVAAGHEVRLIYVSADGRDYAARLANAPFAHRETGTGVSRDALHQLAVEVFSDRSPIRQLERIMKALLEPSFAGLAASARDDAAWADVLVTHALALPLSVAAEAARKPLAILYPVLLLPTRELHPAGLPNLGPFNRLGWWLLRRILASRLDAPLAALRAQAGLARRTLDEQLGTSELDLVAISPTLVPRPADWPAKAQLSGFLSAPPSSASELAPEDPIRAFLEAGPPPIYAGFGSMSETERDPTEALRVVEEAVALAGCRAIIQGGETWARSASSPNVLKIARSSHDVVFPRCSIVVHHGGAGTTQSTLRAGRASVVVAHMIDQTWWGERLARLGGAVPPLSRAKLSAAPLARAIRRALDDTAMHARAEALGHAMRAEDGASRAVELLESLLARS